MDSDANQNGISTNPAAAEDTGRLISEVQWLEFDRTGFLELGPILDSDEVAALRQRADDLALGHVRNSAVVIQTDTGGAYEELPDAEPESDTGTLLYRKINGLENDDLFRQVLLRPVFLEGCARLYGPHAGLSIFHSMIMNNPAGQGIELAWHQDGGAVWKLDRDPLVTIWVALDDATVANGCIEVIEGSHRLGLLSTSGGAIADGEVDRYCPPERRRFLEVKAGSALLLHNFTIRRSNVNATNNPQRAFTACYVDARTRNMETDEFFPQITGSAPEPTAFIEQTESRYEATLAWAKSAETYALSLRDELDKAQVAFRELETYTKSLEAERQD